MNSSCMNSDLNKLFLKRKTSDCQKHFNKDWILDNIMNFLLILLDIIMIFWLHFF